MTVLACKNVASCKEMFTFLLFTMKWCFWILMRRAEEWQALYISSDGSLLVLDASLAGWFALDVAFLSIFSLYIYLHFSEYCELTDNLLYTSESP